MKKINKILLELYNDRKQILFLSFLGYISYLIEGLIPSDPNVIQASGLVIGLTGAAVAIGGAIMGSKAADKAADQAAENARMANEMAEKQLAFQKEQQAKLDEQKDVYRAMEFKNPYENMENAYEDMTVNQQQAQFQAQQGAQQRANIMQGLKGAAGGSGIAGLAQAMAGQAQLQTQQISAQIGAQESQQQALKARGAAAADLQERAGEADVQRMETSRQSTLLGISMGESAGANAAAMQAQQNQLAAGAAQANIQGQQAANYYGMASAGIGMAAGGIQGSDRKLKKNINLIGKSPSGLNIYSFEYKNQQFGKGLFQGVMSDEVPQEVVGTRDGYDTVDYNMFAVEYKQI